ncbi:hypothetical protein BDV19DRAFT_314910 [Aspergillus venezuelensis]
MKRTDFFASSLSDLKDMREVRWNNLIEELSRAQVQTQTEQKPNGIMQSGRGTLQANRITADTSNQTFELPLLDAEFTIYANHPRHRHRQSQANRT